MATITLTIPDAMLPRVVTALCVPAGVVESNANAKTQVADYIKERVRIYEAAQSKIINDIDVS